MSDIQQEDDKAKGGAKNPKALIIGAVALVVVFVGMIVLLNKKRNAAKNEGHNQDEAMVQAAGKKAVQKAQTMIGQTEQKKIGEGIEFDSEGNIKGAQVPTADLPQNRTLGDMEQSKKRSDALRQPTSPSSGDSITGGGAVDYSQASRPPRETNDPEMVKAQSQGRKEEKEEQRESFLSLPLARADKSKEAAPQGGNRPNLPAPGRDSYDPAQQQIQQVQAQLQSLTQMAAQQQQGGAQGAPGGGGMGGPGGPGGSFAPATQKAQVSRPGEVADMRIGGGPEYIIPEGKFIDVTLQNRVNVSTNENPVVAMVTRDVLSEDGHWVLFPAGSIVTGSAGRVESMAQSRVFIPGHRLRFPNGKAVYFPERYMPQATTLVGELGADGKVNRHWMLRFGSAIALGLIEGLAAYEAGPVTTSPLGGETLTPKQSAVMAASQNFNMVAQRLLDMYSNVPPDITLPIGKRMKFYFSQDVRVNGYMPTSALHYVHGTR